MAVSIRDGKEIVRCNKCGKVLDQWDTQEDFTIHKQIGYGSKYDGEEVKIRLCCECMDELIGQCMFSPIVRNHE